MRTSITAGETRRLSGGCRVPMRRHVVHDPLSPSRRALAPGRNGRSWRGGGRNASVASGGAWLLGDGYLAPPLHNGDAHTERTPRRRISPYWPARKIRLLGSDRRLARRP